MKAGDKIVLLFAGAFVLWLYAHFWVRGEPGNYARIISGGEQGQLVNLSSSRFIYVEGMLGTSRLHVSEKRIRFIESPCKNKVCIHSGWLELTGDISACLPNRIAVEIAGNTPRFDAINF